MCPSHTPPQLEMLMPEMNEIDVSCVDPEGEIGGLDPPGKSQVIWVSIEISIWTPLEKVGPPLDPLKSMVFSLIKSLDLLCKL